MTEEPDSSASERPAGAWQDEAELIGRVAAGSAAASRLLVDRYLPLITRYAYRCLGDAAEAEDIAQETFMRLWRQAPAWQPRAQLSTWLYRVAHNLCVDRLRARRTRTGAPLPEPPEPPPQAPALLERREVTAAVVRALDELPPRQRTALALVYYEGLKNYEAAEVMGVQVDALESLLARGRRKLKQRLRPGGSGDSPAAAQRASHDSSR